MESVRKKNSAEITTSHVPCVNLFNILAKLIIFIDTFTVF